MNNTTNATEKKATIFENEQSGDPITNSSVDKKDTGAATTGMVNKVSTENANGKETTETLTSGEARKRMQEERQKELMDKRDEQIRKTLRAKFIRYGMSAHELQIRLVTIEDRLKALRQNILNGTATRTWKDLEVGRIFTTEDKIAMIDKETLVVGIDIGKEKHHIRAFNKEKIELDRKDIFRFTNREEGLEEALVWIEAKAVEYGFTKIVMGCEPTGHYWFNAALYFIRNGITVVVVNPNAVKKSKELDDNSQEKDDDKDPLVIGKLLPDGRFSIPYFPEGNYDALRQIETMRIDTSEEKTAAINRLHRWIDINFPEFTDVIDNPCGAVNQLILMNAPLPQDILEIGISGIQKLFRDNKLHGIGIKKAMAYYQAAKTSIGSTENPKIARFEVQCILNQIRTLDETLARLDEMYVEYGFRIENLGKVLAIRGIGMASLLDMLGEVGDLSRFENAAQIFKLAGLVPVHQASGKYAGQYKISKRGRKRLRKHLWTLAKNVTTHSPEWRQLYQYYRTRSDNPLTGFQAYMAIAGKLLRVIYAILRKGFTYDPDKLLSEVKRIPPKKKEGEATA